MVGGNKTVPRYVSISPDLRYLLWRAVESQQTGGTGSGSGGTVTNNNNHHGLSTNYNVTNAASGGGYRRPLRTAFGFSGGGNHNNSNTNSQNPPNEASGLTFPLGDGNNTTADDTMTTSGAEDVVSIPLSAFESVEYHPAAKSIELRAKPGQSKNLILEYLGQTHTAGSMAELFLQPQYQYATGASANSITFMDFVLSGEEWTKSLRYLVARANQQQPNHQVVSFDA
jgi:hypothetical protein